MAAKPRMPSKQPAAAPAAPPAEKTGASSSPGTPGFIELGSSGLRRTGNRVFDSSLVELTGRPGAKRFREMADLSPTVGTSLLIFKLLLRDVVYRVEPPPEDEAGAPRALLEQRATFVDQCLRDMEGTFDDVLAEACTQYTYGWAFLEETYKLRLGDEPAGTVFDETLKVAIPRPRSKFDDGMVGWASLALRAQETLEEWKFDANNRAVAMLQADPYGKKGSVWIPLDKGLHFRTESVKQNPEGRSLLVPAYLPYKTLKRILEIEAIGVARELNGIPLMRVPQAVVNAQSGSEEAAAKQAVERILIGLTMDNGAGIYIPSERDEHGNPAWDVELLSNSGTRAFDTTQIVSRYDHRIATTLLTAFMLLGQDKVGTQALAVNNTDIMLAAINGLAGALADVFSHQGFPRLMRVNGWPAAEAPRLVAEKVRRVPTLDELGKYLNALAGVGVILTPDADIENDLRSRADLPTLKTDANGEPIRPEPEPEPEPLLEDPANPDEPEDPNADPPQDPPGRPAPKPRPAPAPKPKQEPASTRKPTGF